MRRILRENGLSLAMFGLFLFAFSGQIFTGFNDYNEEQQSHKQAEIGLGEYLTSGHFIEATFENWESEFLQMGTYVILTAFLFQKGSSESKSLDSKEKEDQDPRNHQSDPDAPWPVRRGGLALSLYQYSLGLALFLLFAASFALHAVGGAKAACHEQMLHGEQCLSTLGFMGTARFWFQSFQNWQSEFLSVGVLVVLSIFLRQRGSPESKAVFTPHSATGKE